MFDHLAGRRDVGHLSQHQMKGLSSCIFTAKQQGRSVQ